MSLKTLCTFISLIYVPYFLNSSIGSDSSVNDLLLYKKLFEYRRFDYRGFEEQSIFVCGLDVGKPILEGGLVFKVTCEAKTLGQLVQMVACDGCDGCNVKLGRSNQTQLMLSWLVSCISHLCQLYF